MFNRRYTSNGLDTYTYIYIYTHIYIYLQMVGFPSSHVSFPGGSKKLNQGSIHETFNKLLEVTYREKATQESLRFSYLPGNWDGFSDALDEDDWVVVHPLAKHPCKRTNAPRKKGPFTISKGNESSSNHPFSEELPFRELTYPLPKHFMKMTFPFPVNL